MLASESAPPSDVNAPEAVDLADVPEPPHDLAAVRVVADGRVPLDGLELAAAEVGLDDADVVGDATVPVVDRDVAGQRRRSSAPQPCCAQPRLGRRDVRASLGVDAGAVEARADRVARSSQEAVADEDVAPGHA